MFGPSEVAKAPLSNPSTKIKMKVKIDLFVLPVTHTKIKLLNWPRNIILSNETV